MAPIRLCDVERDTIANRALNQLMHHYSIAEEKDRLVLTKKAGDMMLFLHDLDDLHQLDFVQKEGDRTIAQERAAAGELEDPCLDGRGAVARSYYQNRQQWRLPPHRY